MKEELGSDKQRMKERHLVNVKEAAEYLAISPMTIRRNQWNGVLSHVRIGRRVLFDVKDLDKFIEINKFSINKFSLDLIRQKSYHK